MLVHLPDGRRPTPFAAAVRAAVRAVPSDLRLTLTWDQGIEMARHDLSADLFSEGIYFARPGQPWIRPVNENTNGPLRQYLPRSSDLDSFTDQDSSRSPTGSTIDLEKGSAGAHRDRCSWPATLLFDQQCCDDHRNRAGTRPDQLGQH